MKLGIRRCITVGLHWWMRQRNRAAQDADNGLGQRHAGLDIRDNPSADLFEQPGRAFLGGADVAFVHNDGDGGQGQIENQQRNKGDGETKADLGHGIRLNTLE